MCDRSREPARDLSDDRDETAKKFRGYKLLGCSETMTSNLASWCTARDQIIGNHFPAPEQFGIGKLGVCSGVEDFQIHLGCFMTSLNLGLRLREFLIEELAVFLD